MYSYTTVYTMAPVFSLVWDEDVSVKTALTFPELYKDLMKVCKYVHSDISCYDLTTGEVTVFQNFPFVGRDQHVPRYEENTKR